MISTLDDFITEFTKIKEMGWVRTHRAGPTGIGKTLEDLLGIQENNIDGPDFGDYELKSARLNSNSMLTLFTRKPDSTLGNSYLREKYGYASGAYDNDEKVLHSTLSTTSFTPIADTGSRLKIVYDEEKIYIASNEGIEPVYWEIDKLQSAFEKKYKSNFSEVKAVYAKAECRGHGENEEFYFKEAYEISGFNFDAILNLLEEGKIYIDLRIGQYHDGPNKGKTHDHGTGIRIKEIDQHLLFKIHKRIV